MISKKGISPLIGTVLILGFTMALAAVILIWGQRLTNEAMNTTPEFVDGLECIEWNGTHELRIYDAGNISDFTEDSFPTILSKEDIINAESRGHLNAHLENERFFNGTTNAYYDLSIADKSNDSITIISLTGYIDDQLIEGLKIIKVIFRGVCIKYVKTWEKE